MSALDLPSLLGIPKLSSYLKQIDTALATSLEDASPLIQAAGKRQLLASGKHLRPAMVLAVVHAMGKPINKRVIAACASIELAHISSLIHDDLIDNASSRRGIPTINSQEGMEQAIIVGDYLLVEACKQAATINTAAVEIVATAIGKICDGQSREVADQYNIERDGDNMLASIRGKTAELFAAACRLGGLCAGLPPKELDALTAYGQQFGMAFQLLDDVLDLISTDELLGKPVGNDIVEGVYTMPILLALHGTQAKTVRAILEQKERPNLAFVTLLITEYAIGKTLEVADAFNGQATAALQILGKKDTDRLALFPGAYVGWALNNLVAPEYKATLQAVSAI
jgi:heptaprenyl diphosphate synthase